MFPRSWQRVWGRKFADFYKYKGSSIFSKGWKNSIDRAKTDVSEFGLAKFICDRECKLLGAHILGERAGEIIHETQAFRLFDVPFTKAESMIHIYPAFNDIIKNTARLAYRRQLEQNFFIKTLKKIFRKKEK